MFAGAYVKAPLPSGRHGSPCSALTADAPASTGRRPVGYGFHRKPVSVSRQQGIDAVEQGSGALNSCVVDLIAETEVLLEQVRSRVVGVEAAFGDTFLLEELFDTLDDPGIGVANGFHGQVIR